MAATKHPGFKAHGEKAINGLFAEMHPAWKLKTPLQAALESALNRGGNSQYGTITDPPSTSLGQ